ncbi:MAG: hypothetical protein ACOCRB_02145 [Halanaerobiaceae bacterium]
MSEKTDIEILRNLATRVAKIASKNIQEKRRKLWKDHNSFERVKPPIYIRGGGWINEIIEPKLQCSDEFYRGHELYLRRIIYQDKLGDDFIVEPWITQRADYILPEKGHWGVEVKKHESSQNKGAFKVDYPIKELEDINKLEIPSHKIDEEETRKKVDRLKKTVGDILEINLDRGPFYRMWSGDISTDLGYLRGIENFMLDVYDNPEWLKDLLSFFRDGVLKVHQEAEAEGDWQLANHQNQSMPYCHELKEPEANSGPVMRNELWGFMAAQEFAEMSPEHHYEFMLKYQIPIMEKFALTAYGCCEDLTHKIDILREIPNLRRIAVTPFADVAKCAEKIGTDYICSWRPSPAATVCNKFDENNIEKIIRNGLEEFKKHNCFVDICLKDVHTVQNDPDRLKKFVDIVRECTFEYI